MNPIIFLTTTVGFAGLVGIVIGRNNPKILLTMGAAFSIAVLGTFSLM